MSDMNRHAKSRAALLEREFGKTLGWQVAKAGTLSYRTVAARLRNLEQLYLKQLKNEVLKREVRRRIAEQMFQQAIFHNCSLPLCKAKLNELTKLGFENIERKGHFYLLYTRGALARGHRLLANRTARAIVNELERSVPRRKSLLAQDLLVNFKSLLAHVQPS
jgi:hypothetical protein